MLHVIKRGFADVCLTFQFKLYIPTIGSTYGIPSLIYTMITSSPVPQTALPNDR